MKLRGLVVIAACGMFAGCGGTANQASPPIRPVRTVAAASCNGGAKAKQAAQRKRLGRDLRQLRLAAATMKHYAQDGNAATNKALDRFMLDIGNEALSAVERNRFIDHAAAIVGPHCYLCFQTLEYSRPLAAGAKLACG